MTRRFGVQLSEAFDFLHRQIVTAQIQPGVKEHAAVPGGENEVIAANPARLVGIMPQRVAVKDGAHFRAAQRKPQMSRLRRLHRIHAQPARLVSRARKNFKI